MLFRSFYITEESKDIIAHYAFVESLVKCNHEILLMVDRKDENSVQKLKENDVKKFVCVTKKGLDLSEDDAEKERCEEQRAEFESVGKDMKVNLDKQIYVVEGGHRHALQDRTAHSHE